MVCYKIIREHRGEINFVSELGKGTTVDILLPFKSRFYFYKHETFSKGEYMLVNE